MVPLAPLFLPWVSLVGHRYQVRQPGATGMTKCPAAPNPLPVLGTWCSPPTLESVFFIWLHMTGSQLGIS